jgi:hypothetical protein
VGPKQLICGAGVVVALSLTSPGLLSTSAETGSSDSGDLDGWKRDKC